MKIMRSNTRIPTPAGWVDGHYYTLDGKVWFPENEPFIDIPEKEHFDRIILGNEHIYEKTVNGVKIIMVFRGDHPPSPGEVVEMFKKIGDPREIGCNEKLEIEWESSITCV